MVLQELRPPVILYGWPKTTSERIGMGLFRVREKKRGEEMTTFEKAIATQGAERRLIESGYFCIPRAETALDRGLADVNAELRKECAELRAEIEAARKQITQLETVLEQVTAPIRMYRASRP